MTRILPKTTAARRRCLSTLLFGVGILSKVSFGLLAPSSHRGRVGVSSTRSTCHWASRRQRPEDSYDYYNTEEENYEDEVVDDQDEEDSYWDEAAQAKNGARGGVYKVYFDSDIDEARETQLDWETCLDGDALVLLPPEAVERPSAVLHFVGGTFFGSAPKLWYRSFLEGVVRNTQCAIVITPVPVTLLNSPLQHVSLCKKLKESFETAWEMVLEDEYGDISDLPLCGVGHSLGARLMVVLATLTQNQASERIPSFKSFVLLSFTNYGASAGIPGLSTLMRQSRKQEKRKDFKARKGRKRQVQRGEQSWRYDDEGYDDYEDESWDEVFGEFQGLVKDQADRVRNALTPSSKDLEFFPTPDMLWKAVEEDGRFQVPETLLVQFDDDPIDQSSKLAQVLKETNSSDVKFARLRGTHLTPVMVNRDETTGVFGLPPGASKSILKAIRGQSKLQGQENAMRDLRSSISRYITDVVTKS